MLLKKYINLDSLLVFFLIALSTIPFFKKSVSGLIIVLIIIALSYKKVKVNPSFIPILAIIVGLETYHFFFYKGYELFVFRDQIIYFVIAALAVRILNIKFLFLYINTIYIFCLISIPIFFGLYINKELMVRFSELFSPLFLTIENSALYQWERISPIFYNFDGNFLNLGRNNGPFWEPTVFATMLIIAQIFNFLITKQLFNKKGIVFTIAIITTFSTTGYLAYILLVACTLILSEKIKFNSKLIMIISLLLISPFVFSRLSFLESKIKNEIQNVQVDISEKGGDSRLASAILDIQEMRNDAVAIALGKGNSKASRTVFKDSSIVVMRNCGDTALIVQWGIFFALFYFYLIYKSFARFSKFFKVNSIVFPITCTIIFLICGFSETFFELPFFHTFIFFGLIKLQQPHFGKQKFFRYNANNHLSKSYLQPAGNNQTEARSAPQIIG